MKYYIIAGEASGDLHGANLMKALYKHDSNAEIRFWGGDAMQSVGGTIVRHIRDLAFMGFVEVALHLSTVLNNIKFCKKDILQFNPDAIIYIDYPGFNLKIAKYAHRKGYKNFHYISPQLWAWKKGRIKSMRRDLDGLYYILPFEQKFYAENSFPQAKYVGHPLLDAVKQYKENEKNPPQHNNRQYIALLPGSRKQELRRMLPPMLNLAEKHPEYRFVIAGMHLLGKKFYEKLLEGRNLPNVEIRYDKTYEILSQSHAALVCSGTATLETALFGVPQVVCYRANALSVAIARHFIGKNIQYISLVNLIADKPIVKELIQNDFSVDDLEASLHEITDNERRQQIIDGYNLVKDILGQEGASERTAQNIIEQIDNPLAELNQCIFNSANRLLI